MLRLGDVSSRECFALGMLRHRGRFEEQVRGLSGDREGIFTFSGDREGIVKGPTNFGNPTSQSRLSGDREGIIKEL